MPVYSALMAWPQVLPALHWPLRQSSLLTQVWVPAHAEHSPPPQSVPVSPSPSVWSKQYSGKPQLFTLARSASATPLATAQAPALVTLSSYARWPQGGERVYVPASITVATTRPFGAHGSSFSRIFECPPWRGSADNPGLSAYSARSIWLSSRIAPLETTVSPGEMPLNTTTRWSRTAPATTSRFTKRPAAFFT
jgi:hypothetical protein